MLSENRTKVNLLFINVYASNDMSTEGFDISSLNSLLFSHIIISININTWKTLLNQTWEFKFHFSAE